MKDFDTKDNPWKPVMSPKRASKVSSLHCIIVFPITPLWLNRPPAVWSAPRRQARPLVGALGAAPLLLGEWRRPAACDAPGFKTAVCMGNEAAQPPAVRWPSRPAHWQLFKGVSSDEPTMAS